jgi:drug/metabolite transporter (DMT)-like permease
MVLTGVGLLANVDWTRARLGLGETETVVASIFFTAQILWLDRPDFASNRTGVSTTIMFVIVSGIMAPIVLATMPGPAAVARAFGSAPTAGLTLYLTIVCTLASCLLMNHWQKKVSSTHASLIYGAEPLFAGVFALFLPGLLSAMAGVDYPNETPNARLIVGGGLITVANAVVLWDAGKTPVSAPATASAKTL